MIGKLSARIDTKMALGPTAYAMGLLYEISMETSAKRNLRNIAPQSPIKRS